MTLFRVTKPTGLTPSHERRRRLQDQSTESEGSSRRLWDRLEDAV